MFICICAAVSESELHACIDDGARTLEDVGRDCAAGTGCGTCLNRVSEILERHVLARAVPA